MALPARTHKSSEKARGTHASSLYREIYASKPSMLRCLSTSYTAAWPTTWLNRLALLSADDLRARDLLVGDTLMDQWT